MLQRPVNWVLWSVRTNTALIIIPEEAELLIPIIRGIKDADTYLLTYAAPVTQKMLQFNNLTFCTVPDVPTGWKPPTWLSIELGIFAGRLYFYFEEYTDLRRYLSSGEDAGKFLQPSIDTVPSAELQSTDVVADIAVREATMGRKSETFSAEPLTFLQKWLAVRRKGQDFTHTPMGYVCQGKALTASHPFFNRHNAGDLEDDHEKEENDLAGIDGKTDVVMEVDTIGECLEENEDECTDSGDIMLDGFPDDDQ